MHYLLIGFFTTIFFENQIVKNYDMNNQNLSIKGIFIGWFFQEYLKETYNLTAGKFFITNSELKYKIILKFLILLNNILNILYLLTLIELFLYLSLIYLILILNKKTLIYKISLYIFVFYLVGNFVDILFLLKPFCFFFINLFKCSVIIILYYIIESFFLNYNLKKIWLINKTLLLKLFYQTFFIFLFLTLCSIQINFFCNNPLKEVCFKLLLLTFYLKNANYKSTLSY